VILNQLNQLSNTSYESDKHIYRMLLKFKKQLATNTVYFSHKKLLESELLKKHQYLTYL